MASRWLRCAHEQHRRAPRSGTPCRAAGGGPLGAPPLAKSERAASHPVPCPRLLGRARVGQRRRAVTMTHTGKGIHARRALLPTQVWHAVGTPAHPDSKPRALHGARRAAPLAPSRALAGAGAGAGRSIPLHLYFCMPSPALHTTSCSSPPRLRLQHVHALPPLCGCCAARVMSAISPR